MNEAWIIEEEDFDYLVLKTDAIVSACILKKKVVITICTLVNQILSFLDHSLNSFRDFVVLIRGFAELVHVEMVTSDRICLR